MAKMGKMVATVGLVSAVAAVLSACAVSADEADEIGVCIDPNTNTRIDDDKCVDGSEGWDGDGSSVWFWYSTTSGHSAPPLGHKVNTSHGYSGAPKATYYARGGVPHNGSVINKATISRGGFGGASKGGSSGS